MKIIFNENPTGTIIGLRIINKNNNDIDKDDNSQITNNSIIIDKKKIIANLIINDKEKKLFVNNNYKRLLPRIELIISKAIWAANDQGHKKISLMIPFYPELFDVEKIIEPLVHAGIRATWVFDDYKIRDKNKNKIEEVEIVLDREKIKAVNIDRLKKIFDESVKVAESINLVRRLGETTAEDLTPQTLADEAKKVAKQYRLKINILDEKELKKKGYDLIVAVGRGSNNKPRLITIEYKPKKGKKNLKKVAFVGKGVTFDTGGYGLKPSAYMYPMKDDMCGAATVLGTIEAAAKLQLPFHIIGILCAAENMINGEAYRPSDILKSPAGISVEVSHTDAEGRLVLADGLYHASLFKPDYTIDLATLTGASIITLGTIGACLMSNNDGLANNLLRSGLNVNERLWRLPLWDEHQEDLLSDIADTKTLGHSNSFGMRDGDTMIGGHFLKQFVKGDWAHIDIGGTANVDRPRFFTKKGVTGYGVRLLIDFLKNMN